MTTETTNDLAEFKIAAKQCADLDALITLLSQPGNLDAIGDRPEHEASLAWMPTFGGELAGDGGEGWEVLSWDRDRIAVLKTLYGEANRYDLDVRLRAE